MPNWPEHCEEPSGIECRTVDTHEFANETADAATCDVSSGLKCVDLPGLLPCVDYEVRYWCCEIELTFKTCSTEEPPKTTTPPQTTTPETTTGGN